MEWNSNRALYYLALRALCTVNAGSNDINPPEIRLEVPREP